MATSYGDPFGLSNLDWFLRQTVVPIEPCYPRLRESGVTSVRFRFRFKVSLSFMFDLLEAVEKGGSIRIWEKLVCFSQILIETRFILGFSQI